MFLFNLLADPKKLYERFIHIWLSIDFYMLWLFSSINKKEHPFRKGEIKEYGNGFFEWSPYFPDNNTEGSLNYILIVLSRFFVCWILEEVHIVLNEYSEETDNLKCMQKVLFNKESFTEKKLDELDLFIRINKDRIVTQEFHIRLNEKGVTDYMEAYMKNCVNDDITVSKGLLYSFSKQLSEVRKDIVYARDLFWKRPFNIRTGSEDLVSWDVPKIDLFSVLYFLERQWYIQIIWSTTFTIYFHWKIPTGFQISITPKGMEYFEEGNINKNIEVIKDTQKVIDCIEIDHNESLGILNINWTPKKLLQKQQIFMTGFFDLCDNHKDGWVQYEELAFYDDNSFETKEENEQEKIIKNFYNIWNNLNKSINLETGIDKLFETSRQAIRLNIKYQYKLS